MKLNPVLATAIAVMAGVEKDPPRPCSAIGCSSQATCAVGVAFYPPRATMAHYRTNQWLNRLICGLYLCDAHFADVNPEELLGREALKTLAATVSKTTGFAVDLAATKCVQVSLTDPDLKVLEYQRAEKDAATQRTTKAAP